MTTGVNVMYSDVKVNVMYSDVKINVMYSDANVGLSNAKGTLTDGHVVRLLELAVSTDLHLVPRY